MLTKKLAALAAILMLSGLTACADDRPSADTEGVDESPTETTEGSPTSDVTCDYPSDGQQPAREVEAPPATPAYTGEVEVTLETTAGDLELTLDAENKPCTVGSFLSLAEQDFFDETPCPRIASDPGFGILQCGDPSGTGSGGPGYSVQDELVGDETYPAGTLAMANAGVADSNGSQFFFVFEDSGFPPSYTVFGTLDEASIKLLRDVAKAGHDGSHPAGGGVPNEKVDIQDVVIH